MMMIIINHCVQFAGWSLELLWEQYVCLLLKKIKRGKKKSTDARSHAQYRVQSRLRYCSNKFYYHTLIKELARSRFPQCVISSSPLKTKTNHSAFTYKIYICKPTTTSHFIMFRHHLFHTWATNKVQLATFQRRKKEKIQHDKWISIFYLWYCCV